MKHPFNTQACGERLLAELKKYGKLVIGFDFDNTIFDFHGNGGDYSEVINLLVRCTKEGHTMCLYSLEPDPDKLKWKIEYAKSLGIGVDYINESPLMKSENTTKPFFSVLLDDRAGLQSAYESLYYAITNK